MRAVSLQHSPHLLNNLGMLGMHDQQVMALCGFEHVLLHNRRIIRESPRHPRLNSLEYSPMVHR